MRGHHPTPGEPSAPSASVGPRLGVLDQFPDHCGALGPGRLVGGLQRRGDVQAGFEEQPQRGQGVAHGHRFDVGRRRVVGRVGNDGQPLVWRQLERFFLDRIPDRLVNALRITRVQNSPRTCSSSSGVSKTTCSRGMARAAWKPVRVSEKSRRM